MKKKIIFIVVTLIIAFTIYGITYSKYASNSIWDYYLKSKGFYLTSDNLSINGNDNANNTWDGGSVHFNLKNSMNQNLITSYDINYNVECSLDDELSEYAACYVYIGNPSGNNSNRKSGILSSSFVCNNNNNDGVLVDEYQEENCLNGGYEWINAETIADLYFDVVLLDESHDLNDIIVTINVDSTAPYVKSLSGRFILHKGITSDKIITDYKIFSNYDRLTISNTYNTDRCIEINWNPSKLVLDKNNQKGVVSSNSNGYINSIKLKILANESVNYSFYKLNKNNVYTKDEFIISEATGCTN